MFQEPHTKNIERTDHVWFRYRDGWICGLCGALADAPPPFPTSVDWIPTRYLPLTDKIRGRVALKMK